MSHGIAVGTKVFKRSEKLADLLGSVPEYVETVYVADDGHTDDRTGIYRSDWPFRVEVIDLEYDAGLGAGRRAIVDQLEEQYLVIVDTDHVVPENLGVLREILEEREGIGGVSGAIVEPDRPTYYITGQYFSEPTPAELFRTPYVREDAEIDMISGYPFVRFDLIANAAMFRKECVKAYPWDPNYVIGNEHVDFYVGHWKNTDWVFGACPSVVFEHYPGGGTEYEKNRYESEKLDSSKEYFLEKWSYERDNKQGFRWVRGPPRETWYFGEQMSLWQTAVLMLLIDGPAKLIKAIRQRYGI